MPAANKGAETAMASVAVLAVYVTPRAGRNEIVGEREGAWWVKLAAPPVEGAANQALISLLADRLGVPPGAVTCGLIGLGRNLVQQVRRQVAALAGIPAAAQLFHCSHTHSGPETGVLTTIGQPDAAYLLSLEERLAQVVAQAARDTAPVQV